MSKFIGTIIDPLCIELSEWSILDRMTPMFIPAGREDLL